MKQFLLPEGGQFYKANMHMHTTVSDGSWTPEETKARYKEQGYSIVAFTDHEIMVPHDDLADEDFLPILSYEFAVNKWTKETNFAFWPCYHLNFYAKDPKQTKMPVFVEQRIHEKSKHFITDDMRESQSTDFRYSLDYINGLVKKANDMGFLVSYNHPYWSLQNYEDYAGLEGIWGVEFMNTGCYVEGYHLDCDMRPIEDMLRAGKHVYPLATDDAHRLSHCFGGHIMVKAEKLDYATVMDALERGDFYASTGPQIKELTIEDGVLHVVSSPCARISVSTERRFTRFENVGDDGKLLTEATFDMNPYLDACRTVENLPWEPYFRVTLLDEKGLNAFSRAYYVSELK